MIRLISDTRNLTKGTAHGFGVDENTAVVITHADTNQISAKVIIVNLIYTGGHSTVTC